jgi:hypothetical protein
MIMHQEGFAKGTTANASNSCVSFHLKPNVAGNVMPLNSIVPLQGLVTYEVMSSI